VLDSAGGRRLNHRGEQRFALCSTFKLLAAALVLARHDRGEERLERRVVFERDDLVPYSPATEAHAGASGMTLAELCEAAVVVSDNTAGNLLLASFGGPPALTAFARTLGDRATRIDRIEPALNENLPDDPRDTTTPAGMLASLQALLLGDALRAESRARLLDWLQASTTGARRPPPARRRPCGLADRRQDRHRHARSDQRDRAAASAARARPAAGRRVLRRPGSRKWGGSWRRWWPLVLLRSAIHRAAVIRFGYKKR
jgi:beta-lactamase class A